MTLGVATSLNTRSNSYPSVAPYTGHRPAGADSLASTWCCFLPAAGLPRVKEAETGGVNKPA